MHGFCSKGIVVQKCPNALRVDATGQFLDPTLPADDPRGALRGHLETERGGDVPPAGETRITITQAVIYGWYDNELGSYVNILGDRTVSIAESME